MALALAAGRGQPIFWVTGRMGPIGGVNKDTSFKRIDKEVRDGFQHSHDGSLVIGLRVCYVGSQKA